MYLDCRDQYFQTEAETHNNSVRLDFLKFVQIFFSSKTQICTVCLNLLCRLRWCRENLDTSSVQICVLEERKMWTTDIWENLDGQKLLRVSNSAVLNVQFRQLVYLSIQGRAGGGEKGDRPPRQA